MPIGTQLFVPLTHQPFASMTFSSVVLYYVRRISISSTIRSKKPAEVSHSSLSLVIRLTLEVLTFAQAAECIHKSYDVSAERILYCNLAASLAGTELAQLE